MLLQGWYQRALAHASGHDHYQKIKERLFSVICLPLILVLSAGQSYGAVLPHGHMQHDRMLAVNGEGMIVEEIGPNQRAAGYAEDFLHIPVPQRDSSGNPGQTVDSLSAKANDWTEPSKSSEAQYVLAVRSWLKSLEPRRRETARRIMRDAHPVLHDLREAIREKKAQLASIRFDRDTRPETLPRMGLELQRLRAALHTELASLKERISREVGVDMGPLGKDTFWLSLPAATKQ